MRGEVCVGFATVLSLASVLLLIFAHVGQINTSNVPRSLYMAGVNMSHYGDALQSAVTGVDNTTGLYTSNASVPLLVGAGIRQFYRFGLYSHCAYVDDQDGICSNHTVAYSWTPYDLIVDDMAFNYSNITNAIVFDTTFRDSGYLGPLSKAAFWMIFLGTLCAAVALFVGLPKHHCTFFMSTVFSIISSVLLLIGAAIWTIMIKKAESVNGVLIGLNPQPIGIVVSLGPGLLMVWAAFACMFASVIPHMVSCCTYRG